MVAGWAMVQGNSRGTDMHSDPDYHLPLIGKGLSHLGKCR